MAIHTSANFYRRGIPNTYAGFSLVAQSNNVIPAPMGRYLRGFNFYNRQIVNTRFMRPWPWNN